MSKIEKPSLWLRVTSSFRNGHRHSGLHMEVHPPTASLRIFSDSSGRLFDELGNPVPSNRKGAPDLTA